MLIVDFPHLQQISICMPRGMRAHETSHFASLQQLQDNMLQVKASHAKPRTVSLPTCLFHQSLPPRRKVESPQMSNQHLRSTQGKLSLHQLYLGCVFSGRAKNTGLPNGKPLLQSIQHSPSGYQLGAPSSLLLGKTMCATALPSYY